ncbi:MAG: hypothetical protein AAB421_02890 [Patescibacteria group bacterium]
MSSILDPGTTDEYESRRVFNFSKRDTLHINGYIARINQAGTESALLAVRRDLERSDLIGKPMAMQLLRRKANERAKELRLQAARGSDVWW